MPSQENLEIYGCAYYSLESIGKRDNFIGIIPTT